MKRFVLCSSILMIGLCGCGGGGPEPVITREEYQNIQTGMTLQQVEAIIGAKGSSTGTNKNNPSEVVEGFEWKNTDNSNLYCSFVNNKLDVKVKMGF